MQVLRTPDSQFEHLSQAGYPFTPHYIEVDADPQRHDVPLQKLRIHYIDEGPTHAEPVLLLHGEPTWSFLYRKVVQVLVRYGYRCIAPDFVGFGRSDKPASRSDYTYARHVTWMRQFLEKLDLKGLTLVCQDWGGLIGLRLVAEVGERFARVVVANTYLPTGTGKISEAFLNWQKFSQRTPILRVGGIVEMGCRKGPLPPEVVAAYDAPFPNESYKSGARAFPMLVPTGPCESAEANNKAWHVLEKWEKPFLCAFSDSDPVTKGLEVHFLKRIPGEKKCEAQHVTIKNAGHFLQEDAGEELGEIVAKFIRAHPLVRSGSVARL